MKDHVVPYLEEKLLKQATQKLLEVKWQAEIRVLEIEAWLERQEQLSQEEKNNISTQALEYYDQVIKPAEKNYDKEVDQIRTWKKIRQQFKQGF